MRIHNTSFLPVFRIRNFLYGLVADKSIAMQRSGYGSGSGPDPYLELRYLYICNTVLIKTRNVDATGLYKRNILGMYRIKNNRTSMGQLATMHSTIINSCDIYYYI
jgi:hypothetical protein